MSPQKVSLKAELNEGFLPLVLAFAEETAKAFGLGSLESDKVRLAGEEIFLYLCRKAQPGQTIEIEARNGIYYLQMEFLFAPLMLDPHALNLTANVAPDEEGLENLGLLIASRSVDRFHIRQAPGNALALVLIKEKAYPEAAGEAPDAPPSLDALSFSSPDAAVLKRFARSVCRSYTEEFFPSPYRYPAKLADMVGGGEYRAVTATGTGKQAWQIGGGLLWRAVGKGMIEFFGPYIFDGHRSREIATGLIDHLLGQVAKGDATFVATSHGTPELPRDYFEVLGEIELRLPDGGVRPSPFFYRQLNEDAGCQVWAHPELTPFLRARYDRLFLPREILPIAWEGEKRDPHSAFTVQFDRPQRTARLWPVWDGEDAAAILADHIRVLSAEGLINIFVEIDLGRPWQGLLTPPLLRTGFVPALLMPNAGQGDIVVFQYR